MRLKVREPLQAVRRLGEVTGVLGRHLGRTFVALGRRWVGPPSRPTMRQVIALEASSTLADLGPTFIKLGQVLSTRPDLIAPTFEHALSRLQDSAPSVPTAAIHATLQAALGVGVDSVFSSFTDEPLAAASIGQVHAATFHDRQVAVKIRRPGVTDRVEIDLAILNRLARAGCALFQTARRIDLTGFIDEFGQTLRAELDYVSEAGNADRLRPRLTGLGVHVPEVIWSVTTREVLTMERIFGTKIDDLAVLDARGVDRPRLARSFAEAYLAMVFIDGYFHADPHPGNLFVESTGRLAMVDFGMVGTVEPAVRRALIEILLALPTGDVRRSARALHELGVVPTDVDELQFLDALGELTHETVDSPLADVRIGPLLIEFMAVSRRHHLRFPRQLALLVKTVIMCEGLAAELDPNFSLATIVAPFVASAFQKESHS